MTIYDAGTSPTTLLLLHGTGGSERDLIPIAKFLAPQAARLAVGGRVVENDQARYFAHTASGGFDLDDAMRQATWLTNEITAQLAAHHRDPQHAIVLGYSNGANIAAYAMLRQVVPWRDAMLLHPVSIEAFHPTRRLLNTRVWLTHGAGDPYSTKENFSQLQTQFTQAFAAVATYSHRRGHALIQAELNATKRWLQTILKEEVQ